ncbi:hypothetical protein LPJ64_001446 [Coemansia asiatica]|uniref:Uncharacterized protein n=1 Tax=Coemansia asiatica TaxID=1052880 RepID=A0A9W7XL96_9FUNG|nr:hypothetical protein LPJ64_001446 [Coemansia asiatica]
MEDVNSMLATATIIYIEHINSLVKSGRLHDYDYFDKDGKEVAQLMGLETPTQFSTFMRKQEIYLIKALVRYTLFPAIFSGPSVSLKSHSALLVEKPKFLPLDLSDIEICMALMIGRHGTAMTEKLDECILNVISNFILESKSRGYRYPDTYIINKSTPDWLLASILSDMLNLDMGVPEYMALEIQASKDIYKKLQKISAPLALPEPIFAPTKTKPQETSTTSTGGSPTRIDPKLIDELVMVVNDFPVSEDKNLYIQSFLDSFFPEISKENKN